MTIPWDALSESALRGVIEEFVTREGTEYGASEFSLDAKISEVKQQLAKGEVVITFDEALQTCSIALIS
jgi:uncharacterized protein YheU (UPF0270 family)